MDTGDRIRELRKKKGLNQTELGEILGLSHNAVSAIESNRSNPTKEAIIKISEFFSVSTDYLLTGKEGADTIDEKEQEVIKLYREDSKLRESLNDMISIKKKVTEYAKNYQTNHLQSA